MAIRSGRSSSTSLVAIVDSAEITQGSAASTVGVVLVVKTTVMTASLTVTIMAVATNPC